MCLGVQLVRGGHQGVGPSLLAGPARLLDFRCALSQPLEGGIQFLLVAGRFTLFQRRLTLWLAVSKTVRG